MELDGYKESQRNFLAFFVFVKFIYNKNNGFKMPKNSFGIFSIDIYSRKSTNCSSVIPYVSIN